MSKSHNNHLLDLGSNAKRQAFADLEIAFGEPTIEVQNAWTR